MGRAATRNRFFYRRLESLSDIIFGVAMTMLIYNVPLNEKLSERPTLAEIWRVDGHALYAMSLSFAVSLMFWVSHHRRLAFTRYSGNLEFVLTALFLFSIAFLPLTSSLYGIKGADGDVLTIYATHLAIIAALNTSLWVVQSRLKGADTEAVTRRDFAPAVTAFVSLTAAALFSSVSVFVAQIFLYSAFLSPLSRKIVGRGGDRDRQDG